MRPREKILRYGVDRLSNAELLALLLNTGRKGKGAKRLAAEMLRAFGVGEFDEIDLQRLMAYPGVGLAKASRVVAAFELGRRFLHGKQSRLILSRQAVWREMRDIREEKREHFVVFYLDVRSQLIRRRVVSIGTLNASMVHPREVFEMAIKYNSAQIIVAHNHPSGVIKPSLEDFAVTERLVKAGMILGIEVLDHIIITKEDSLSLRKFVLSCRRKFAEQNL